MNPDEFPDTAVQLPPLEVDNQLHVLSLEETALPLTPAQEIGVVDGEFQVYRNPTEGETEGHFETGWTVTKSFDAPVEDGSAIPALMLEKVFDTGRFDENGEKVFVISKKPIQLEVFRSWQQPHTSEVSDVDALAAGLQGENVLNTDLEVGSLPDIAVVEEIGETAVEESGAVELVIAAEPTVDATNVSEALPESGESVDFVAIFADGPSLETTLQDLAVSPELRSELVSLAEQWKSTMSTVAAIERVWGEDLRPVVQDLAGEAAKSVSGLHTFVVQLDAIQIKMERLGTAREYNDVASEQAILKELERDHSFDVLDGGVKTFSNPDESLPSTGKLKNAALVAFENVNHAGHVSEMTDGDYNDLAAYAQPLIAMGVSVAEIQKSIVENNDGIVQLWKKTETTVEEVNSYAAVSATTKMGQLLQNLVSHMNRWRDNPNEVGAHTLLIAVSDLMTTTHDTLIQISQVHNVAEQVVARRFLDHS